MARFTFPRPLRARIIPLGLLAAVVPALTFAADADKVSVVDAYVRQAPPGAMATGAFMVVKNAGDKAVKIVKADNSASKITELHTHLNEGGMMKMRPVKDIEVPAKGEAVLKPGSLHVMMIDLKAPLVLGSKVPITLGFEDGSSKKVEALVKQPMADGAPMMGNKGNMGNMGHDHH